MCIHIDDYTVDANIMRLGMKYMNNIHGANLLQRWLQMFNPHPLIYITDSVLLYQGVNTASTVDGLPVSHPPILLLYVYAQTFSCTITSYSCFICAPTTYPGTEHV